MMDAFMAWLRWQAHDDPFEFVVSAVFVLGLPVLAGWAVWLARRTRS